MIRDQRTRVFWTYTNRFTETNAAGGSNTVVFTPAANTAMVLVACSFQMCNSAAGRASTVDTIDEDGATLTYLAAATMDNQTLQLPAPGSVATTVTNTTASLGMIVPGDGSRFRVYAAALAQNEYFDVVMCWELLGTTTAPTVTHTSTGTASTGTASQNEITVVPVMA